MSILGPGRVTQNFGGGPMNKLSGTKELIFDTFIDIASRIGYENANIRKITGEVGIKPASLYNHFENKDKLLEYAYEYYVRHQYDNRARVDVMKRLVETASAKEIIARFTGAFSDEDQKKHMRMVLIAKIIYMRMFQDPIANAIFVEANTNHAEYIIDVLRHGINVGRIDPDFDTETFAGVLIGTMEVMRIKSFVDVVDQCEREKVLALLALFFSTALK